MATYEIKRENGKIERRVNRFGAEEFNGFIPLLDKILELSQEVSE